MAIADRFWPKVDSSGGPDACWPWLASTNGAGYGHIWVGSHVDGTGRLRPSHRVAYELAVGEIPAGHEIDHRCHNEALARGECAGGHGCLHRRCANPRHLIPATHAENAKRGATGLWAARRERAKTACPAGHAYDTPNTRWYRGNRLCRECNRERMRRRTTERNAA